MLGLIKNIAERIARTEFARKAISGNADLSLFKAKLSGRVVFGLMLIGLSYLIGWPAVAFFSILSIYFGRPLILIIGGPVIYGISHLVFIAGAYLAGAKYTYVFLRWATRKALERILGEDPAAGRISKDACADDCHNNESL
jgi:hypothetical protein